MPKTQETQIEHFPDRSLRRLLQDREYVRGLVQIIAPDIETFLDFSQITYEKRSFISKALQERESDVLLSVPFQENTDATNSEALLIYILIEHQSTVDKTMGFRLLSYMVQIWESQRREWETKKLPENERRLQPILPILFYTGDRPWTVPVSLTAIMDVPEILERFVPSFDTLLLGVKETKAEALTQFGHPLGWLLRVLQKEHADETEISEALADAMSHIALVDENFAPQVAEALRYFVQLIFHRRSRDERDALVDIIRQHIQDPKELEAMAQTTAEFLIEQGIEQGKVEGKQDTILKFLQLQFQHVPETLSREIRNIHNLTFLDTLLEQAMTAQSLEEIDTQFSLKSPRND
ncbi:MAG: Rpn family recombination-promoting nuclease/putative transposase [Candidatus Poribacteria bacterium]|nr:Rpn family recombination-promoting nuclease/putative transposase [Candidatus Poribacteria bacterium]